MVLFRRSTGRHRHLVPSPVPSPSIALLYVVLLVSLATRNVGMAVLCGPRELDSVARKRTDFELLCRTPLRSASKSFIYGLAPENVLRVQVRSVYLSEVEARSFNHLVTPITSCLVVYGVFQGHPRGVVLYRRKFRRYGCSLVFGICVCRSLQSFGEATRLPRMPVACKSVSDRRSCAGISQR